MTESPTNKLLTFSLYPVPIYWDIWTLKFLGFDHWILEVTWSIQITYTVITILGSPSLTSYANMLIVMLVYISITVYTRWY